MPVPKPIAWSCGIFKDHSHDTKEEAQLCIRRHTVAAPYGLCPQPGCYARGYKRVNGQDECEAGHSYPSHKAVYVAGNN